MWDDGFLDIFNEASWAHGMAKDTLFWGMVLGMSLHAFRLFYYILFYDGDVS
jgi:hypothetical protein